MMLMNWLAADVSTLIEHYRIAQLTLPCLCPSTLQLDAERQRLQAAG